MNNDPLHAPKLKINRAKKHITDLNNSIIDYVNSKPYRVVIEQDTKSTNHLWTLRVRNEVPCEFSAIIGDVVHNLRAPLDLLMCDMVRLKGKSTGGVCFPFCEGLDGLDDAIKSRNIRRAGENIVDIVRGLKPYRGGNEKLRGIHDLDISDKHTGLFAVIHHVGIKNLTIGNSFIRELRSSPVKDGSILISAPPMGNVQLGQYFQPSFDITFGDGQPFAGQPVFSTLQDLTNTILDIINIFDTEIHK